MKDTSAIKKLLDLNLEVEALEKDIALFRERIASKEIEIQRLREKMIPIKPSAMSEFGDNKEQTKFLTRDNVGYAVEVAPTEPGGIRFTRLEAL